MIVVREEAGPRAIEKIKIQPKYRISGHRSTGIVFEQCKGVNTFRRET